MHYIGMRQNVEIVRETIAATLKEEGFELLRLYLFGSRARGDFSSQSDYDVMAVLDRKPAIRVKIKLFSRLRRELAKQKLDVDIIIKSAKEVKYYQDKKGHIVRAALAEGVLV